MFLSVLVIGEETHGHGFGVLSHCNEETVGEAPVATHGIGEQDHVPTISIILANDFREDVCPRVVKKHGYGRGPGEARGWRNEDERKRCAGQTKLKNASTIFCRSSPDF